jgi:hypothetical protein
MSDDERLLSISVNWRMLLRMLPTAMPSWLLSLVFHLSLVLLLALLQVARGGSSDGVDLMVDARGADSLGDDGQGLLAETMEIASDLAVPQLDASAPKADAVADAITETPKFELPGIAAAANDGGGLDGTDGTAAGGAEGAAGVGDGPVRTQVFGLVGEGTNFVYVFDRSDSMNSVFSYTSEGATVFSVTPLEAAKAELLRSLKDLDGRHRFHIIFYNHEPWIFDPGRSPKKMIQATRVNKRRASAFVSTVYGQGNTNHLKPLEIAIKMKPDVIFLLTDGEAKDDPTPYQLQQLARLNSAGARINVVQFCFTSRKDSSLVKLAEESGGRHLFINIAQLGPGMQGAAGAPGAVDVTPGGVDAAPDDVDASPRDVPKP